MVFHVTTSIFIKYEALVVPAMVSQDSGLQEWNVAPT